jgi:hypothetical protein
MNRLNGECNSGLWRHAESKRQEQTKREEMCFVIEQSACPCVACGCTARTAKLDQKAVNICSK